ncbi:MAG: pseudouridine synthase [Rhodoferax sp.]
MVLPAGPWPTVLDFLVQRFAAIGLAQWLQRMHAGAVLDDRGELVTPHCVYQAGRRLYYYRALATEPRIPFEATLLWRDSHLLVLDKPHFLPVQPSGKYLQETLLVRLKNALGLDDLSPLHRIDRDTAGVVLFSVQRSSRAAYHALFRQRQVEKTYEAVAPWNPALQWPLRRASRIGHGAHFMQQAELGGAPNAITEIAPLETHGDLARYALRPVTGQRHQLRVHMAALGLPIVGDGIYPMLTPERPPDFARPLQLLARALAFTDPLTGEPRRFASTRQLRPLAELAAERDQSTPPQSP